MARKPLNLIQPILLRFPLLASAINQFAFVQLPHFHHFSRQQQLSIMGKTPLMGRSELRRSKRLSQKRSSFLAYDDKSLPDTVYTNKRRKKTNSTPLKKERSSPEVKSPETRKTQSKPKDEPNVVTPTCEDDSPHCASSCLPRTREIILQSENQSEHLTIIGVDEAGRGPLAGPVVVAAAIVPSDIPGVIDSKQITKEEQREKLFESIVASRDVKYAVAIVSARRIDEINILQATLQGMKMAVEALMKNVTAENNIATAERNDISYVITGGLGVANGGVTNYHALIDGNKIPEEMPCPTESMTKGDSHEYSIGAASIIAKVTRDRLMHEYAEKYPEYNLAQHKGYPTSAHMNAVKKFGASPIHRRTFAPLKHMKFDNEGKIIA